MVHHWRRHGRTRVPRWTRLTATIGLLFACALAGLPAAASASTPEVRGEWTLILKYSGGTVNGTALISEEADTKGKFAAHNVLLNGAVPGAFTGTLEGATATVETSSQQYGPIPPGKFNSSTMTVESTASSLSLSGSGKFAIGGEEYSATLVATRVKTYKQIEEQEAREKQEQEERAARGNVRGEWAITLEGGGKTLKGTALIVEEASATNAFASKSALFESFIGGTFTGKLKGGEAEVTITTEEVPGMLPPGTFTSKAIAVSSKSNPTSMSGTGMSKFGPVEFSSTLTATRTRSYQQIEEQATKEREAKEKQEKEAQEAAEKVAREKHEQEQRAKELKERQEREKREAEKTAPPKPLPIVTITPLMPVEVGAKTLTLSHSGAISLSLTNPGGLPEHGHLKLTLAKGKAASAKHTSASSTLGEASFTIAPHGTEIVKVKLSQSGRSQLTRHKTLRVLVTVTTQASGQPDTTRTYSLTLRAAKATHGKH